MVVTSLYFFHVAVDLAAARTGRSLLLRIVVVVLALQVAALRVLAGLLEASAEGMDAFRVRDGFNVLYHALAQGHDALQQARRRGLVCLGQGLSGRQKKVSVTNDCV